MLCASSNCDASGLLPFVADFYLRELILTSTARYSCHSRWFEMELRNCIFWPRTWHVQTTAIKAYFAARDCTCEYLSLFLQMLCH